MKTSNQPQDDFVPAPFSTIHMTEPSSIIAPEAMAPSLPYRHFDLAFRPPLQRR